MPKIVPLQFIKKFFRSGSAGGFLLLSCVIGSLMIANSPWADGFETLLNKELGFSGHSISLRYSLLAWINDGLMAVFFLLVGLEIKRELIGGELSSPRKAALPVLAAIGGVVAPACIYLLFNSGTETAQGWGIPMATDIAFAIAIMNILGRKLPFGLKLFLAALAIVDDLLAILVIAVFYTSSLQWAYLACAGFIWTLLLILNKLKVRNLVYYLIPGLFIWYFVHHSGIHATIAGVLVAAVIPFKTASGSSPLQKLEHSLLIPVNFLIMPVFALANTNIRVEADMLQGLLTPLSLGIIGGLLIGKPLGISLVSWLAVKSGLCTIPSGAGWKHIIGVGLLAGIGFTMSVFIALLSFDEAGALLARAKFSILVASVLSGIAGSLVLSLVARKTVKTPS